MHAAPYFYQWFDMARIIQGTFAIIKDMAY